jgi:hypothetical protein
MNKNCHQSSTNCWTVDLRDVPTALTSTCKDGVDIVLSKNISFWPKSKTYCTKKNKQTNNVEHAFTCRANQTFILEIRVSRKNCRETPRQNHDVTLTATCRGCGPITAFECPKHYAEDTRQQRFSLDICTVLIKRRVAISLQRLATRWTVRGSTPSSGGEIYHIRPDRP